VRPVYYYLLAQLAQRRQGQWPIYLLISKQRIVLGRTKIAPSSPISTEARRLWAEKLRDIERLQLWNEHIGSILGIPNPQRQYYLQLYHQLQRGIFLDKSIWHQISRVQFDWCQMINFIHALKARFILYPCSWTLLCTIFYQSWSWGFGE
jgi:hypothetical protein